MKKLIFTILICLATTGFTFAQAPATFKYQAVVRDISGNIIPTQVVKFRITLLKGSPTGTESYKEQHTTATNQFGIANLEIGTGSSQVGTIDTIEWGNADYFIKIELDPTGSSGYTNMGTSQLLSVPYALYANKSQKALNDNDTSASNEIQTLSYNSGQLSISNGNAVSIGGVRTIAGKVWGCVSYTGDGFSVICVADGIYNLSFATPFTNIPTIVARAQDNAYPRETFVPSITNISINGFSIVAEDDNHPAANIHVCSFIAVGN